MRHGSRSLHSGLEFPPPFNPPNPMNVIRLCKGIALTGLIAATVPVFAQSPSPKKPDPANAAYEAFNKLRNDKDARIDQARFQAVAVAGLDFLTQHPSSSRAGSVISSLASYGGSGKENAARRMAWLTSLKFELLDRQGKEGLSPDAVTALAALDSSLANALAREDLSRENVEAFRSKIDALAKLPGSERFLYTQERGYGELLNATGRVPQAEAFYKALLSHPDKRVVEMATTELGLIEARRTPYTASFTDISGKPIDFGQMRQKVVLIVFWSPLHQASSNEQVELKNLYFELRKKGLEIVGVACAKEADREKVAAFVKSKKLPWPTYFDGKEFAGDIAKKFNIRSIPAAAILNKEGMLVATPTSRYDREVKRLLGIKTTK